MHDFDNNTKLDGLEILKALTHLLPYDEDDDEEKTVDVRGKSADDIAREKRDRQLRYYTGISVSTSQYTHVTSLMSTVSAALNTIVFHRVFLSLNHCHHLEIHRIMLISVYIERTKCFYCVVLYSVLFGRLSYFFLLLCLYYYCVILMFVLYDMLVALVALCHL